MRLVQFENPARPRRQACLGINDLFPVPLNASSLDQAAGFASRSYDFKATRVRFHHDDHEIARRALGREEREIRVLEIPPAETQLEFLQRDLGLLNGMETRRHTARKRLFGIHGMLSVRNILAQQNLEIARHQIVADAH